MLDESASCETTSDCGAGFVCNAEGKFCEKDTGPILLGHIAAKEGFEQVFLQQEQAMTLAIETVNANGGVLGRSLDRRWFDDRPVEAAEKVMQSLADARVVGIVGPTASNFALAIAPLVREKKIITISPAIAVGHMGGYEPPDDRWFLSTAGSPRAEAHGMALHARKAEEGAPACERVFVFASKTPYLEAYENAFTAGLSKLGGCVAGRIELPRAIPSSYTNMLDHMKKSGADCVLLSAFGSHYVPLLHDAGLRSDLSHVRFLAASNAHHDDFLDGARKDTDGAAKVLPRLVTGDFDGNHETAEAKWIKARYNERFGLPPEQELATNVMAAFDSAILIALAVERAGTATDRIAIRDALASIVALSPDHEVHGPQELALLLNASRRRRELGCGTTRHSVPCEIHYRGASSDLELDETGAARPNVVIYRASSAGFTRAAQFLRRDLEPLITAAGATSCR